MNDALYYENEGSPVMTLAAVQEGVMKWGCENIFIKSMVDRSV
ncbi:MAG: hypothetical protein ACLUIQ_02590 [Dialister invisus]